VSITDQSRNHQTAARPIRKLRRNRLRLPRQLLMEYQRLKDKRAKSQKNVAQSANTPSFYTLRWKYTRAQAQR